MFLYKVIEWFGCGSGHAPQPVLKLNVNNAVVPGQPGTNEDDFTASQKRLSRVRAGMKQEKVDVFVQTLTDAHASETVQLTDQGVRWVSGFTGSAATVVITQEEAHLFTDGRYHIQAAAQLSPAWTLEKVGIPGVMPWQEFILKYRGVTLGIDAELVPYASGSVLIERLHTAGVSKVRFVKENPINKGWGEDRPCEEIIPAVVHPLKYTGEGAYKKLERVRKYFAQNEALVISSLVWIAWLLNVRGKDILYTPVVKSHVIVTQESFTWFVKEAKLDDDMKIYIESLGGSVVPYESFVQHIRKIPATTTVVGMSDVSLAAATAAKTFRISESFMSTLIAVKNPTESRGYRNAYRRDGAAWVKWAAWLEREIKKGAVINEYDAGDALTKFRAVYPEFRGLAYTNISATGANAALPHYAPSPTNSRVIDPETPYLNDSGAQYVDGTIDTTRTVFMGRHVKPEYKRAFTRVLQGHIALDSAVFPKGTTGGTLDTLPRQFLWQDGLNYSHGSGHGVGHYLSVHEMPPSLAASDRTEFLLHATVTNEPGYYKEGSFGIRIESFLQVVEAQSPGFYKFDRITRVPIDLRLVEWSLLSRDQKIWLKEHNRSVMEDLRDLLQDDDGALDYVSAMQVGPVTLSE